MYFRSIHFFFFLFLSANCAFAVEAKEEMEKVYFSSPELQVTDQGLYLFDAHNGYIQVNAVFSDDMGLYILAKKNEEIAKDTCFNGHKIWCWRCVGCALPWCKGRCRCVEWPFSVKK